MNSVNCQYDLIIDSQMQFQYVVTYFLKFISQYSVLSQEIGLEELLQNDLFFARWDLKP